MKAGKHNQAVIPNGRDSMRRLYHSLRDLRVGALYLLAFFKGEPSKTILAKSLNLQAAPKRRFLAPTLRLRIRFFSLRMTVLDSVAQVQSSAQSASAECRATRRARVQSAECRTQSSARGASAECRVQNAEQCAKRKCRVQSAECRTQSK